MPRTLVQPLQQFLQTEVAGGAALVAAAMVALAWANSPWADSYVRLWHTTLSLDLGGHILTGDLTHWINDLGMALFFFVAGLEIKRELVHGDLRTPRVAALPIACAVGGMLVPAAIYAAVNAGGPGAGGWGIPMATDIAFSIGVLALVGRRVPVSLKVFLLTLAIVDDIGAIVVIAVFYGGPLEPGWMAAGVGTIVAIVALQRCQVRSLLPYLVLAAFLWLATYESGVHATIAGVVLGLLTPARPFHRPGQVRDAAVHELSAAHLDDEIVDEQDETTLLEVARLTSEAVSPLARLERRLHPWSSLVVLPLFALANAGIEISRQSIDAAAGSRISLGVFAGLLLGKPLGIMAAAFIVVKVLRGSLPRGAGWIELAGVGVVAGIGFTVSLFVAGLAFAGPEADEARLAILATSLVAGALGATLLAWRRADGPAPPTSGGPSPSS